MDYPTYEAENFGNVPPILSMPPCFDCGIELTRGNIWVVDRKVMDTKKDYDYRLSATDPKAYLHGVRAKNGKGTITVCNDCDDERMGTKK